MLLSPHISSDNNKSVPNCDPTCDPVTQPAIQSDHCHFGVAKGIQELAQYHKQPILRYNALKEMLFTASYSAMKMVQQLIETLS
jgi:hypothetical protein